MRPWPKSKIFKRPLGSRSLLFRGRARHASKLLQKGPLAWSTVKEAMSPRVKRSEAVYWWACLFREPSQKEGRLPTAQLIGCPTGVAAAGRPIISDRPGSVSSCADCADNQS